ncbi:MAG: hypothetical protein II896_06450 [Clostridia bacterium]|nr:hypothetical protein [Clostridia bacterium]
MCKIATKEEQKAKAIEFMRTLDIYKPYIHGFEQSNRVCFFERFGGYWVDQELEIFAKMKEVEETYNCTVYAITHELTTLGEMWSCLYVSQYTDDWEYSLTECEGNAFYVASYVWNKSDDLCSELGDIVVRTYGGGLSRVF